MISDFYIKIGGGYQDAKQRLVSDKLIEKVVLKFPAEPAFTMLTEAINAEDVAAAFSAVHRLKGVALNLSFERLAMASVKLTDAMRETVRCNYSWAQYRKMFAEVEQEYKRVIAAIEEYQQG